MDESDSDAVAFSAKSEQSTGSTVTPRVDATKAPMRVLAGVLFSLASRQPNGELVLPWWSFPTKGQPLDVRLNEGLDAIDVTALEDGLPAFEAEGAPRIMNAFTSSPVPVSRRGAYTACLWALVKRAGGFLRIPGRELPIRLDPGTWDVEVVQTSKSQRVRIKAIRRAAPPSPQKPGVIASNSVANVIAVDPRDVK